MIKANLWNRLFHADELRKQEKQYQRYGVIIDTYPTMQKNLTTAKSLSDLLIIHMQAWGFGFRTKDLSPDPYGMFRTKDIMDMKPEEVYLGNRYGLWTFNIPEWELHKDEVMGVNNFGIEPNTRCYDLIMEQYCLHLKFWFMAIFTEAVKKQESFLIYRWVDKKHIRR